MADTNTADQTQETPQAEQAQDSQAEQPASEQDGSVDVHEAELSEVQAPADGSATGSGQIDIVLDTAIPIEVCLGRTELTVGQLLQLGPGSVIKLDKLAGEPVELLLRNVQFASGSLVVVGDQLGVKIKEILSAQEQPTDSPPAA